MRRTPAVSPDGGGARYSTFPNTIGKEIVKRRLVPRMAISSLVLLIGCYSPRLITKDELKAKAKQVDITVLTRDSVEYRFLEGNYGIRSDTLLGYGVRRQNTSSDIVLDASLALVDVASIEIKEINLTRTLLLCGGGGLFAVLIFVHYSSPREVPTTFVIGPN